MEDDADVCCLVQLIFVEEIIDTEEVKARYPLAPPCLLTTDFCRSLNAVLSARQLILSGRWYNFFNTCSLKMLSSHEMYVQHIMYACLAEKECTQNIFDSFISVCALVIMLGNETLQKTGLNFRALNPFIIMIFYRNILKDVFCRRGGFQRLVEYISNHRYLSWICQGINIFLPDAHDNDVSMDLIKKLEKELKRERSLQNVIDLIKDEINKTSSSLATATLQTTDVKLPNLPKQDDLVRTLVEYRRKEKSERILRKEIAEAATKFETLEVFSQGYPCLNSDSKTSYIPKQRDSEARCENIVQAVIIYNNSKTSAHGNTNNRIQEEADGILKHFKDTVESLIEVLNEYDNE